MCVCFSLYLSCVYICLLCFFYRVIQITKHLHSDPGLTCIPCYELSPLCYRSFLERCELFQGLRWERGDRETVLLHLTSNLYIYQIHRHFMSKLHNFRLYAEVRIWQGYQYRQQMSDQDLVSILEGPSSRLGLLD